MFILYPGAWVALLVAIFFFILGYAWYFGQTQMRQYLHCYAQTTALPQLPHRLGFMSAERSTVHEEKEKRQSLLVENQVTSSGDEDEDCSKPIINVLPPATDISINNGNEIEINEPRFRKSITGNVLFTVTPGLGVFLTTSSRHTPHVFERVLAQIHAVCVFLVMID